MTKEELLAKKAALEAEIETKKLEKEISDLEASKVEVIASNDPKKTTVEMQKSAQAGDYTKFEAQFNDMQAQLKNINDRVASEKEANRSIYIPSFVEKALGSKGPEVIAFAKDYARLAPTLDGVAFMMKKPVWELDTFKKNFPGKGRADVEAAEKALTVAGSGTGTEYVPTVFNDQLAERLINSNMVLKALPILDLPANPYRMPIYTGVPTSYYCTEGSTVTAADPATSNKDFDARKVMNKVVYSGELQEDSIIPILPFVQKVMLESLSNAIETVVLMGDTVTTANTNINLIDGTPTTTAGGASVYLTRDGLVKNCFASNGKTEDLSSDSLALGFAKTMGLMNVGALDVKDLVAFANISLAFKYMGDSSFATWDKLGPNASLLNGMLGAIYGVAFAPTSGIPLTNSAGKVPAAGGTLGSLVIVKKSGVLIGFRRRPTIIDNDILQASDQRSWVGSFRLDTKVLQPNQTDRAATAYLFNAAV